MSCVLYWPGAIACTRSMQACVHVARQQTPQHTLSQHCTAMPGIHCTHDTNPLMTYSGALTTFCSAALCFYHVVQELEAMDQASVAMLLWSLGKLQLQPPEAFLQAAMAATQQVMPSMSLLSVVSILESFKALQYLPPLPWLLEVCAAARAKVTSDSSPKGWQRRKCVRRFEETVEWYNQAMQAAAQGGGNGNGVPDDESQQLDKQQQRQQARVGMLAASSAGSEAVLAAAVGVAAAVAQQWHP